MDAKRNMLVEKDLSLRGAIRIIARVRPQLPGEPTQTEPVFAFPSATADDCSRLVLTGQSRTSVDTTKTKSKENSFEFQRVFPPTSKQSEVFDEVEGLIESAANGHRVCLFAYGQTGL